MCGMRILWINRFPRWLTACPRDWFTEFVWFKSFDDVEFATSTWIPEHEYICSYSHPVGLCSLYLCREIRCVELSSREREHARDHLLLFFSFWKCWNTDAHLDISISMPAETNLIQEFHLFSRFRFPGVQLSTTSLKLAAGECTQ